MEVSLLPPGDPTSSRAEHRRKIVRNIELSQQIARDNIARAQQKMKGVLMIEQQKNLIMSRVQRYGFMFQKLTRAFQRNCYTITMAHTG